MSGYGDDSGFTAWLEANGYELSDGALPAAVLRQRGSTYVDGLYGPRFSGSPTGGFAQERAWPRAGAYAYGSAVGSDVIPDAVVQASYHAAYVEALTPGTLSVTIAPGKVKKRVKVEGAVEVEYAVGDGAAAGQLPVVSAIEGLLSPYLALAAPEVLVV